MFFRDEVKDFQTKHTFSMKKGGYGKAPRLKINNQRKPVVSTKKKDWRI
jgi:hypothetical protein